MIRGIQLVCVFVFSVVGCDDGGGNGGSGDPVSGTWHYSDFATSMDPCGVDDYIEQDDGDFGLVNNGDDTFTVTPGDGSDPFQCNLSGSSFNCPERLGAEVDLNDSGFDAVLTLQVSVTGSFSDDEHCSGTQNGSATCAGGDCAAVEALSGVSFPCQLDVAFSAHWLAQ